MSALLALGLASASLGCFAAALVARLQRPAAPAFPPLSPHVDALRTLH